jgi:hypothetical protein
VARRAAVHPQSLSSGQPSGCLLGGLRQWNTRSYSCISQSGRVTTIRRWIIFWIPTAIGGPNYPAAPRIGSRGKCWKAHGISHPHTHNRLPKGRVFPVAR